MGRESNGAHKQVSWWGEGGEGGQKRGGSMDTQTLPGVEQLVGSCGKAQGAQLRGQATLRGGMGAPGGLQVEGTHVRT